jgi:hypothetical protein
VDLVRNEKPVNVDIQPRCHAHDIHRPRQRAGWRRRDVARSRSTIRSFISIGIVP